jgi:hypothetical protein
VNEVLTKDVKLFSPKTRGFTAKANIYRKSSDRIQQETWKHESSQTQYFTPLSPFLSLSLFLSLSPAPFPILNGKKDAGDWEVKTGKIEISNGNVSGF